MRSIKQTGAFKRDLKRESKGIYKDALKTDFPAVLVMLAKDQPLPDKFHDHQLTGEWSGFRECHLKPDLLFLYRQPEDNTLRLVRLGSHSEVLKK
jgi:mRNA interferase YafQ